MLLDIPDFQVMAKRLLSRSSGRSNASLRDGMNVRSWPRAAVRDVRRKQPKDDLHITVKKVDFAEPAPKGSRRPSADGGAGFHSDVRTSASPGTGHLATDNVRRVHVHYLAAGTAGAAPLCVGSARIRPPTSCSSRRNSGDAMMIVPAAARRRSTASAERENEVGCSFK